MQKKSKLKLLVVFLSTFLLSEFALAEGAEFATSLNSSTINTLENVADNFRATGASSKVVIQVPTVTGTVQLSLEPNEIRSPDFQSQFTTANGVVPDTSKVSLFKGAISGKTDDSFVRVSVISGIAGVERKLSGFMKVDGIYYSLKSDVSDSGSLVIKEVSEEEMARLIAQCGVNPSTASSLVGTSLSSLLPDPEFINISGIKVTEIATEADFEFVSALGSKNSANAEILSILNAVDALYQAQLSLKLVVVFQNAWTVSADPYLGTNSINLLNQFVSYWDTNFRNSKDYDIAHLFTGRTLDSGVAGIAYVGVVCNSLNYGLSSWFNNEGLDVPLVAHEIGHNFGANHDNCGGGQTFIMCPFLNLGADTFSPISVSDILDYVSQVSCLEDLEDINQPPVLAPIGQKSVTEEDTLTFNVTASDPEDGTATLSASGLPTGATFTGGVFTYTPSLSAVSGAGSEVKTVTFTATDSGNLTDSEVVEITVNNKNQSPVFDTIEDETVEEGDLLTVVLPVTDPDADELYFYAPNGMPAGMSLDNSTGELRWRPSGDQAGDYEIDFEVKDAFDAVDMGTLSVTVTDKVGVSPYPASFTPGDIDGDGIAEIIGYRPQNGAWVYDDFVTTGSKSKKLGKFGDVSVIGDYNGDNITDFTVFRPSENKWYINYSGTNQTTSFAFGNIGDIPISGDFDGDGRTDYAVFRPLSGKFLHIKSSDGETRVSTVFGQLNDLPVPCDYDGDGETEFAVVRRRDVTKAVWIIRNADGSLDQKNFSSINDYFIPGDYLDTGSCQRARYRAKVGKWYVDGAPTVTFGGPGNIPAPADYDGDGDVDLMLGAINNELLEWSLRDSGGSVTTRTFGSRIDKLAITESMFFGLRHKHGNRAPLTLGGVGTSAGFFRPSTDALISVSTAQALQKTITANAGSTVLRGDYNGDGELDIASFENGTWRIYHSTGTTAVSYWGTASDKPVAGDFDGDGKTDIGIYRPDNGSGFGNWWIVGSTVGVMFFDWGLPTDVPIPADFNGDGLSDPTIFRPSTGGWAVLDNRDLKVNLSTWGNPGDIPFSADLDGDERADQTVYRPSAGYWYIRGSGKKSMISKLWGVPGDKPMVGNLTSFFTRDIAVYRPGTKSIYILTVDSNYFTPLYLPYMQGQDALVAPPFGTVN
jgi:Metallo-peptidase family M12B Reprolysin-like/Putative Ig domain/FG-GAP-like repeat